MSGAAAPSAGAARSLIDLLEDAAGSIAGEVFGADVLMRAAVTEWAIGIGGGASVAPPAWIDGYSRWLSTGDGPLSVAPDRDFVGAADGRWVDEEEFQRLQSLWRDREADPPASMPPVAATGEPAAAPDPESTGVVPEAPRLGRWSGEEQQRLAEMANAGAATEEIAAALGRAGEEVTAGLQILRRHGVIIPARPRGGRLAAQPRSAKAEEAVDPDLEADRPEAEPAAAPLDVPSAGVVPEIPGGGRWTEEEDRRLAELANAGAATEEIAAALGRTGEAVKARLQTLRRRGVSIAARPRGGRLVAGPRGTKATLKSATPAEDAAVAEYLKTKPVTKCPSGRAWGALRADKSGGNAHAAAGMIDITGGA